MKINFLENKTLLIESNFKTYSFEATDVSKIYISCTSFVFFNKDKEVVKHAIFNVKSSKYLEINTK